MNTRIILSIALITLPACGDEHANSTALDIRLVPDLNLNSVSQVAGAVDTIRVVVDSPQGLYPPGSESVDGNVQVQDEDNDPSDLELAATVSVPPGRLPVVRIERGGLRDVPLDIRFIGHASSTPSVRVAEGLVRGLRFESGQIREVPVLFNLRPERLPPRVVEVQPPDGTSLDVCEVDTIVIVFSKPMDRSTLLIPGSFTVDLDPVPGPIVLDASGYIATYAVENPELGKSRSYRVTVSTSVRSQDGAGLDQVAAEPGAQPYDMRFNMECDSIGPNSGAIPCRAESGVKGSCPGEGRFACVDGACIPVACETASCAPPFVCDPATLRCEVDCRSYGGATCPQDRPACDEVSGVCIPET